MTIIGKGNIVGKGSMYVPPTVNNGVIPNLSTGAITSASNPTEPGTNVVVVNGQTYYATGSAFYAGYLSVYPPYSVFSPPSNVFWCTRSARNKYPYGNRTYTDTTYGSYKICNYSGTTATTDINNTTYLGEWIQIQLPSAISLKSYSIAPSNLGHVPLVQSSFQMPNAWYLLGSNNTTTTNINTDTINSGFTLIDTQLNSANTLTPSLVENTRFNVTTGSTYNVFRLVIKVMDNGTFNTNPNAACGQFQLYV